MSAARAARLGTHIAALLALLTLLVAATFFAIGAVRLAQGNDLVGGYWFAFAILWVRVSLRLAR